VTDAGRQSLAGNWFQGTAAAAVLSFDEDAEAPILVEGSHYAEDLSAMSRQAHGAHVRVPRDFRVIIHPRSKAQ
jgi:hypothetical protein